MRTSENTFASIFSECFTSSRSVGVLVDLMNEMDLELLDVTAS